MQFSNDGSTWSSWEPYSTTKNWTLTDGNNAKTVYAQFQDNSNTISTASAQVTLDTVPPIPYPYYEWVSIANRTLSFDGSGSIDNSPIRFLWNFGDSSTATSVTATHTYAALGNYTAYVTVTDIAGNSATQPFIVYVLDPRVFATNTPTPVPTQNLVATPTATPIGSASTQPSSGPDATVSTIELILLAGVVLLVIIVVVLVFLLKRNRWTKPKPN
jgi:PKD repeat protein